MGLASNGRSSCPVGFSVRPAGIQPFPQKGLAEGTLYASLDRSIELYCCVHCLQIGPSHLKTSTCHVTCRCASRPARQPSAMNNATPFGRRTLAVLSRSLQERDCHHYVRMPVNHMYVYTPSGTTSPCLSLRYGAGSYFGRIGMIVAGNVASRLRKLADI